MKILYLLFLPIICLASEPKFHFGECVKVTTGFYKDCVGRVVRMEGQQHFEINGYCNDASFFESFDEKDLKLSKGCRE